MTKLNVVIPAVNVTVDGVEFRKVDRKAQAGDIVKALVSSLDVEAGAFYGIVFDKHGAADFLDDAGDVNGRADSDGYPEEFEVYAPVSGVTTEIPSAAEITFDNAQYRKVDRSAREGDVIVFTEEADYVTEGTPYLVNEIDSADDAQITDDDGDDFDTCGSAFDVYEKVSAETTVRGVQYREVKRQARAGETVKMTDDDRADGWAEGDTFIVAKIDSDGDAVFKDNDGDTRYKDKDYYVVLEPINAQAKAEPERLSVGDYAKVITKEGGILSGFDVGDVIQIVENPYEPGDCHFRVMNFNGRTGYADKERGLTPATAEEVSAAQAKAQRVAQRKLAVGPFADGGFAQIIDRTKSLAMSAADTDGYVKVSVEPYGRYALSLRKPNGDYSGYCNADALRQIAEEEYNAGVAPKPKFSVGDSVQINVPESETTRYGRALVKNSEIGTVTKVIGERVTVTFPSYGGGWDGIASELTKVSAEEIAAQASIEKEAQEAEEKRREELKWATIGRKVGEFKRGDIVSFVKTGGEKGVGTVEDSGSVDDCIGVRVGAQPYDGEKYRGVFFDEGDSATLITPVEQRFDTAVKSVA